MGVATADFVAPWINARSAGTCSVFTFRFAGKAVFVSGLMAQPLSVFLRVAQVDVYDGSVVAPPIVVTHERLSGSGSESVIFGEGDGIFAEAETMTDRDFMDGFFVTLADVLPIAHNKTPRFDGDHNGAKAVARQLVLEDTARSVVGARGVAGCLGRGQTGNIRAKNG